MTKELGRGQLKSAAKAAIEVLVLTVVFFLLVELGEQPQGCSAKKVAECGFADLAAAGDLVLDLSDECGGLRYACVRFLMNTHERWRATNATATSGDHDGDDDFDGDVDGNYAACLCLFDSTLYHDTDSSCPASYDAIHDKLVEGAPLRSTCVTCDFGTSRTVFFVLGLSIAIWVQLWSDEEEESNEVAYLLAVGALFAYGAALFVFYGLGFSGCESESWQRTQWVISALAFAFMIAAAIFLLMFFDVRRTKRKRAQQLHVEESSGEKLDLVNAFVGKRALARFDLNDGEQRLLRFGSATVTHTCGDTALAAASAAEAARSNGSEATSDASNARDGGGDCVVLHAKGSGNCETITVRGAIVTLRDAHFSYERDARVAGGAWQRRALVTQRTLRRRRDGTLEFVEASGGELLELTAKDLPAGRAKRGGAKRGGGAKAAAKARAAAGGADAGGSPSRRATAALHSVSDLAKDDLQAAFNAFSSPQRLLGLSYVDTLRKLFGLPTVGVDPQSVERDEALDFVEYVRLIVLRDELAAQKASEDA